MNQTRLFLIFAWLMVATLLWMEWGKEQQAANAPVTPAAQIAAPPAMVPGQATPAAPSAVPTANVPVAPGQAPVTKATPSAQAVVATTDVLQVTLDGGSVREADLLKFPQTRDAGSKPVMLFDPNPALRRSACGCDSVRK